MNEAGLLLCQCENDTDGYASGIMEITILVLEIIQLLKKMAR